MRFLKKILIAFILAAPALPLAAQNLKAIDSLHNLLSSQIADSVKVAALRNLSVTYQGFDTQKAIEYANQSLSLAEKTHNPRGLGLAHNNLGDLYWYQSNFGESSSHYLKALEIFEKLGDEGEVASCFRNIGWLYFNRLRYDKAMEYYYKSLAINRRMNRMKELCENYNDIGIIHINKKEYKEAIDSFQLALKIEKDLNLKDRLKATYANMAIAFDNLGQTDKAIESIQKAIDLCISDGNKSDLAMSYCNLGNFYTKKGKYALAVSTLQKSIEYGQALNYLDIAQDSYDNLASTYAAMKNYEKAYEYKRKVADIKDSLYKISNSRQVNEMTEKYESEKKEIAIESLEKDKALSDESLERERNFRMYMLLFCVLLAGFAFALFRGNKRRKAANEALSAAYHEIEVKNKDITDSINYSKRIQDASLPPFDLLYRLFPDSFVFFSPKDIVSGDFYWFTEKDGRKLIAACDCTGHGVPGALMSMIGNNILGRIVNQKGITAPAEILRLLDAEVRRALKQQEHPENTDAIEIALLTFYSDTEVEFAGANRSLLMIRDEETVTVAGNNYSAGGLMMEKEKNFTSKRLSLQKNDCIYLFTDGFADQGGGSEGRKFTEEQFTILLQNISGETMANQQKVVEGAFSRWKASCEQADDVLVIGIRV